MKRKRNSFWTIVFAFLPGAGHMYMGLMKMGLSFMAAFFGIFALCDWLDLKFLGILAPIIWFYSFFDCINKRFSNDEDFEKIYDHYLFSFDKLKEKALENRNSKLICGIILVALGVYIMLLNFIHQINAVIPGFTVLQNIFSPRVIVSVVIIVLGIWLIAGKRKENHENA